MTLMEALLNKRKFYKTDRNYVFTIDKPSVAKTAAAGGTVGAAAGVAGAAGVKKLGELGAKSLVSKVANSEGTKKKALELLSRASTKIGEVASKGAGKHILRGAGAAAGIPIGALIGSAVAKRKLKYADPYVQGILDKVKGQEIKRKTYRNLLKGQKAIGVSAHRLYPRSN